MLHSVTRPDGDIVSFSYDALGRRLSKKYKNTITKWIWDGNKPLHEWKEDFRTGAILSNTTINENGIITWLFNEYSFAPSAKLKGEKKYSILTDHLGTPFQMYKDTGEIFWETQLDSYGKVRMFKGEEGSCPFRYQGQYEDAETGLYYNRFRYFDAGEGIYLTQDPIRLHGGLLFYSYVRDVNIYTDALGLVCTLNENDVKGKTEAEIRALAQAKGLVGFGQQDANGQYRKWKDPDPGGRQRLRIDAGHSENGVPYADPRAAVPHVHAYEADGTTPIREQGAPEVKADGTTGPDDNKHFPLNP